MFVVRNKGFFFSEIWKHLTKNINWLKYNALKFKKDICRLVFECFRTKGKYGSDGKERFTYTQALVFVQCAINTIFAYILRGKTRDSVPTRIYAVLSTSYLFAMITSNHALQYIPYPTQVSLLPMCNCLLFA